MSNEHFRKVNNIAKTGTRDQVFMEIYRPEVLGPLIGMVKNSFPSFDADDIVQNSVLRAYSRFNQFEKRAKFSTWFYTIIIREGYDLGRDREKRNRIGYGKMEHADQSNITPYAGAVSNEEAGILEGIIDNHLSPRLRTVFLLREKDNFEYKDIAVKLSIPIGTVMSRLYDAKQVIKKRVSRDTPAIAEHYSQ